jgi:hypothetical protein
MCEAAFPHGAPDLKSSIRSATFCCGANHIYWASTVVLATRPSATATDDHETQLTDMAHSLICSALLRGGPAKRIPSATLWFLR